MVIIISDESHFQMELNNAGTRLVIVDFTASWCASCQRIEPVFESLSQRYQSVVFLSVDVDQCSECSTVQRIVVMPTFICYRSKVKVGQVEGADPQALDHMLKELGACSDEDDTGDNYVQGHIDLLSLIQNSSCECLNDSDDHPFADSFASGDGYLESDCDEQLILSYGFSQAVKLHSLKIEAPPDNGPKTLKLFINQPRTLDFDQVDSMEPIQTIVVQPEELSGKLVQLHYVKYQNVLNLQLFVKDNQEGTETTRIDHLAIIGSPIPVTNMSDFKRVAGKKGKSH